MSESLMTIGGRDTTPAERMFVAASALAMAKLMMPDDEDRLTVVSSARSVAFSAGLRPSEVHALVAPLMAEMAASEQLDNNESGE